VNPGHAGEPGWVDTHTKDTKVLFGIMAAWLGLEDLHDRARIMSHSLPPGCPSLRATCGWMGEPLYPFEN